MCDETIILEDSRLYEVVIGRCYCCGATLTEADAVRSDGCPYCPGDEPTYQEAVKTNQLEPKPSDYEPKVRAEIERGDWDEIPF